MSRTALACCLFIHAARLMSVCWQVRKAFEDVEGASIAMDIVAVEPDDSIDLGQGCFVRPFLVKHRRVHVAL